MKTAVCCIAAVGALCAGAADFVSGRVQVVIEADAPKVVRFAAEEATNFLSRVLGADVPIVKEPAPGATYLFLGAGRRAAAAGLDPSDKPHDSFFVKSTADAVYVVGRDNPTANPRNASPWTLERGTLPGK